MLVHEPRFFTISEQQRVARQRTKIKVPPFTSYFPTVSHTVVLVFSAVFYEMPQGQVSLYTLYLTVRKVPLTL